MDFIAFFSTVPEAWLALIGALLGGSGLKYMEHWLSKSKVEEDLASSLRSELRLDLNSLREEVRELRKEVTHWREKYYAEAEENAILNSRLALIGHKTDRVVEVVNEHTEGQLDDVKELPQ